MFPSAAGGIGIYMMAPKAPYLPSGTVLHTSRGRKPSTRPGGVSRSRTEPWQPRAERPGGWLNPHARKGVSTFGNTGKHHAGPDPDRAIRRLNPQVRQGLSLRRPFTIPLIPIILNK